VPRIREIIHAGAPADVRGQYWVLALGNSQRIDRPLHMLLHRRAVIASKSTCHLFVRCCRG
jgi:hypothetical protein